MKHPAANKLENLAQRLRDKPKPGKFRASSATKQMIRNVVGIVKKLDHLSPDGSAKPSPRAVRHPATKRA